jgi:hypothetical protein
LLERVKEDNGHARRAIDHLNILRRRMRGEPEHVPDSQIAVTRRFIWSAGFVIFTCIAAVFAIYVV